MATNEQYFPRGGKKPKSSITDRKKFDFLGNADRIGKKRKYRGPKISQPDKDEDHISDRSYESEGETTSGLKYVSAEGMNRKTIQNGMVILGRVMKIMDTKLTISLPGLLLGTVVASHISEAYSRLLASFVNGEIEDVKQLSDLFVVGEYVNVKVLLCKEGHDVVLSLKPQDVNCDLHCNNLKEGMLLRGSIDSVEDHGYVVDLGVTGCRTFLPSKMVDESLSLDVGQVIWCMIKKCQISSTNSIITVTNNLEAINSTCISGNIVRNYTVNDLKPGMSVSFSVNKPLEDGAEGCILTDSSGYIHVSQIKSKLNVGRKVNARVLYVMPITKLPFLTTRKIFKTFKPSIDEEAGSYKVGQIIEDAQVTRITKKSVILKLKKNIGVIYIKQMEKDGVREKYPIGSQHKVRIVWYHLSDYVYVCSDKQDVLEQKYFSVSDLSVGEIVEAKVKSILNNGVAVEMGSIKGWISNLHISDVPLSQSSKSGEKVTPSLAAKKFKLEDTIVARILNISKSSSQLYLTAKPSLLDPDLHILSKIEDAVIGMQYKGVIVSHLQFGVLVSFFGNVKAVVHISELSHEFVKDIPSAFYLGQVVNCTILSVDLEQKKINGSFIKSGESTKNTKKPKESLHVQNTKKIDDNIKSKKKKKNLDESTSKTDTNVYDNNNDKEKKKCKENISARNNDALDDSKKSKKQELKNISAGTDDALDNSKKSKKQELKNRFENIPTENDDALDVSKKSKKHKLSNGIENIPAGEDDAHDISKKDKKQKNQNGFENVPTENNDALDISKKSKKHKLSNGIENIPATEDDALDISKKSKKHKLQNGFEVEELEDLSVKKSKKNKNKEKDNKLKLSDNLESETNNVKSEEGIQNQHDESKDQIKFSSMNNFWNMDAATISKNVLGKYNANSDSEEEIAEEKPKKKKKKLTVSEKVEKARSEEEKLREIEKELALADSQPKSSDQFDRLLLANPNSSELWIAYMAFHLQATEIERARAVGIKALKTISFREEQDKLNIWLALLNIENRFGTQESLEKTLQDALQMNEPFNVHSKMLDMYADTGKTQELLSLIDTMVAKYRKNPLTYIITGEVCYKMDLIDKARAIMQKAITRLDNKTHIPVLIKFAQMENNNGDSERAEALFEQIVGCLPQRVDIWCVYVDMLSKSHKIDNIRLVMERATSQKLQIKKMKTLYKKWVEIEEKIGDPEHVENVRQIALNFVNKVAC